jgi:hypothetical protein
MPCGAVEGPYGKGRELDMAVHKHPDGTLKHLGGHEGGPRMHRDDGVVVGESVPNQKAEIVYECGDHGRVFAERW